MDATRDSHTKWIKSERERKISCDINYMWNLKYGTNDPIYKTETDHGHREQTCGSQQGGGVGWMGSLGLIDANYYIQNG